MEGTVKWFNSSKGYGFIEYKGKDVFVRYTSIIDDSDFKELLQGEKVEFQLVETPKGLKAKYVKSKRVII